MGATLPHGVHGTGPRHVVALHGWLSDRHAFDELVRWLPEEQFTLVAPDIRGYGEAIDVPGEFTIGEVATDTIALVDALGWDDFSVVGHSMGGKAAQKIVALAPERVRRVVGISPVPASGTGFDEPTAALFRSAIDSPQVRRGILDHGTGGRYHDAWLDRMVEHSWKRSTPEAFASYLASWSAEDFHAEVVGTPTPFKIVVGAHDPDLSAAAMSATVLQWFPQAELDVFADAGHYAIDETPIALAAVVHRFLT